MMRNYQRFSLNESESFLKGKRQSDNYNNFLGTPKVDHIKSSSMEKKLRDRDAPSASITWQRPRFSTPHKSHIPLSSMLENKVLGGNDFPKTRPQNCVAAVSRLDSHWNDSRFLLLTQSTASPNTCRTKPLIEPQNTNSLVSKVAKIQKAFLDRFKLSKILTLYTAMVFLSYMLLQFLIPRFWKELFVLIILLSNVGIIWKSCYATTMGFIGNSLKFPEMVKKSAAFSGKNHYSIQRFSPPLAHDRSDRHHDPTIQGPRISKHEWDWIPLGRFGDDERKFSFDNLHTEKRNISNLITCSSSTPECQINENSYHLADSVQKLRNLVIQQCKHAQVTNNLDSNHLQLFARLGLLFAFDDLIGAAKYADSMMEDFKWFECSDAQFAERILQAPMFRNN